MKKLLLVAMGTVLCATANNPFPTGPWTPYPRGNDGSLSALGEFAVGAVHTPGLQFVGVESGRYHKRSGGSSVEWDIIIIASPRRGDKDKYRALVLADNFKKPLDLLYFDRYRPQASVDSRPSNTS
jgi:hypothetical protein